MIKWDKLPVEMKTEEVKKYYDVLKKKKVSRFLMRIFDIFASFIPLIILLPVFIIIIFYKNNQKKEESLLILPNFTTIISHIG